MERGPFKYTKYQSAAKLGVCYSSHGPFCEKWMVIFSLQTVELPEGKTFVFTHITLWPESQRDFWWSVTARVFPMAGFAANQRPTFFPMETRGIYKQIQVSKPPGGMLSMRYYPEGIQAHLLRDQ